MFRNPTLFISLMAGKSGATLVPSSNNGAKEQLFSGFVDETAYRDGAENLALTLSVMATRMATSDTRNSGKPLFVSHLFHDNNVEFESLKKEWNANIGRETLLAVLELHWIHTSVITLDRLGMRSSSWERRSRYGKDYLEWATALHIHQYGILSNSLGSSLTECSESQDPLTDCGLDKNGLLSKVHDTCKLIDCSGTVYDYPVTKDQLTEFLETLRWSYPYATVEGQSTIELDWDVIFNATEEAFMILATNRAQKNDLFVFHFTVVLLF